MTDPAIRDVIRQRIAIHGATAETRDKTMTLIDAWGAEREAAGAVRALHAYRDREKAGMMHGGYIAIRISEDIRKAEAHYQTCQDTLREIMGGVR